MKKRDLYYERIPTKLLREDIFSGLTPHEMTQLSRHPKRPTTLDLIEEISDNF